jgi:glycosyltransferase involved in cell wall biosynthesis
LVNTSKARAPLKTESDTHPAIDRESARLSQNGSAAVKLLLIAPTCDGEDVGEAWYSYQWAKHLAKRHDVTLLTYNKRGAKPASQQLSGLRVVEWTEPPLLGKAERLNSFVKPGYIPFYFRARSWIRAALARGERFDLAHQPTPVAMRYPSPAIGFGIPVVIGPVGGGLSTPAGFAADVGSAPWFMKLRGLDQFRRRWDPLLRRTYEEAACVLGIAPYVTELLAGLSLRRFEIMSDAGLDTVPDPIDRAERSGPVRLLYVGRLVRTKGARDIIRALSLRPELPITLDIVGEGPERAACEALIAKLDLGSRVSMHGWKAKGEVWDFYRNADIFVFPSYREPGGNVALEAMGYSLPLIVVDRGGPGSAVTEACAIKLPITGPEALARDIADAIEKLVTDPGLRRKMGAAAHRHVTKTALWAAKIDHVGTIYADAMKSARGGFKNGIL